MDRFPLPFCKTRITHMKAILFSFLALVTASAQDAATLIQQGDAYDQTYEAEEALKYYLPAEKLQPANADLLVKLARQYVYRMTELSSSAEKIASAKTAQAYAERAIKADPKNSDAYLSVSVCLGKLIQLQGNREKVTASKPIKEYAEKAAKLNPRNDYAWHILARWHQGIAGANSFIIGIARLIYGEIPPASNEEAVKYFQKAISLRPDRLIHHMELGRTYAQMGKKDEARQLINKALAMPNREKDDAETKERGKKTLAGL
jgi:tetratricopeptide (TPR) repeat protein